MNEARNAACRCEVYWVALTQMSCASFDAEPNVEHCNSSVGRVVFVDVEHQLWCVGSLDCDLCRVFGGMPTVPAAGVWGAAAVREARVSAYILYGACCKRLLPVREVL